MEIKGRDLVAGMPKTININARKSAKRWSSRSARSSRPSTSARADAAGTRRRHRRSRHRAGRRRLAAEEPRPPLREETGLPVLIPAENPLTSVVLGAGKMLTDLKLLRKISID